MGSIMHLRTIGKSISIPACLVALLGVIPLVAACGEPELANGVNASTSSAPERPASWPPFRMVYEIHDKTLDEGTTIWQLEYVSEGDWTKTLLQDPRDPGASGSTERFLDETLTITRLGTTDATTGKPWTMVSTFPDAPVAPEPWLLPDADLKLTERGYLQETNPDNNTLTFVLDGTAPCPDDAVIPASCISDHTYSAVEETVFTTEIQPPLTISFTSKVDGEVVSTSIVVELSALIDGQEVAIR